MEMHDDISPRPAGVDATPRRVTLGGHPPRVPTDPDVRLRAHPARQSVGSLRTVYRVDHPRRRQWVTLPHRRKVGPSHGAIVA